MQAAAVRWGFSPDDVGLVTGNRRVNPDAPILVVVAEILFNRLLQQPGLGSRRYEVRACSRRDTKLRLRTPHSRTLSQLSTSRTSPPS